jgi:hypothetical protein
MTSEQILAAIAEATGNTPTSVDDAFITKLKEMNTSGNFTVWVGTSAEYAAIVASGGLVENRLYITTDDSFASDVNAAIEQLRTQVATLSAATLETEWVAIKRGTQNMTIGYYKQVGNMYTISLDYNPVIFNADFDTTHEDSVDLPITLSTPKTYFNDVSALGVTSGIVGINYYALPAEIRKNKITFHHAREQTTEVKLVVTLPKAVS